MKYLFNFISSMVMLILIIVTMTAESAKTDNRLVAGTLQEDLKNRTVVFPQHWERNLQTGMDTWTDCLALEIAAYGQQDIINALTRAPYVVNSDGEHPRNHLKEKIAPKTPVNAETKDYWRYWWGSVDLLRVALGKTKMHLSAYQKLLKHCSYALIAAFTLVAFLRYGRPATPLLPVAFALFFGFGIPLLGQSIAQSPGFIIGMLLVLVYVIFGNFHKYPSLKWLYLFNAGGISFYFDLFNGSMIAALTCFALCELISIRIYGVPETQGRLRAWPVATAIVSLMAAYFLGAVSAAGLRIVLHAVLLHQDMGMVVQEWFRELSKYASDNVEHLRASRYTEETDKGTFYRLYYMSDTGVYPYLSRHAMLAVYFVCGTLYVALIKWMIEEWERVNKDILLAMMFIIALVPLWYVVFAGHALIHFWMTGRLLALFFALAPASMLLLMKAAKSADWWKLTIRYDEDPWYGY